MDGGDSRIDAARPVRRDRYAHLRDNLRTYRFATATEPAIAWCVSCERHHAAAPGGLCPVCAPGRPAAA